VGKAKEQIIEEVEDLEQVVHALAGVPRRHVELREQRVLRALLLRLWRRSEDAGEALLDLLDQVLVNEGAGGDDDLAGDRVGHVVQGHAAQDAVTDALDDLAEVPATHARHDEGDGVRASGDQAGAILSPCCQEMALVVLSWERSVM